MTVRLNITMDDAPYVRLKRTVRPRKMSVFITEAVRARLTPDRATLDAAYRAARKERWRGARPCLARRSHWRQSEQWLATQLRQASPRSATSMLYLAESTIETTG
jgi:hypothetical protein